VELTRVVAVVSILTNPENMSFEQFNYVALEGNIGAGKTTSNKIAEDFSAKTV
jgi:tRNA A37 threonylcarbamoyladenosine biosynthesis protein TsaE